METDMPQYRAIEIDFDVHKLIEGERRGFDEAPNSALRRLLRLPPGPSEATPSESEGRQGWHDEGVFLPDGTRVRMSYGRGKQVIEGQIRNGRWMIGGKTFASPSGAASELAVTKSGRKTKLNGWNYFEALLPGEKSWASLSALRAKASGVDHLTLKELGLD